MLLVALGLLAILHAAWSTIQCTLRAATFAYRWGRSAQSDSRRPRGVEVEADGVYRISARGTSSWRNKDHVISPMICARQVYLECFVGLALCIIGVTRISGDFQTIRPTELLAKMCAPSVALLVRPYFVRRFPAICTHALSRRFDTVNSRPDFAIFHHRGRVFNGGGLGQ